MPENYSEWYWEDLPEKARAAAKALGYSKESWDDDGTIPYDNKVFSDCTIGDKHAALFLGMSPLDDKFDVDWEELDEQSKKAAKALGWDQEKWDDDWAIEDLPCEELYWEDLSAEQKDAAKFFGYSRHTWDQDDDEEDEVFEAGNGAPSHAPSAAKPAMSEHHAAPTEAKHDVQHASEATGSAKADSYSVSPYYGGEDSSSFDHGSHPGIEEILVYSDKHIVHGFAVLYTDGVGKKEGEEKGNKNQFRLNPGEYINSIKIRFRKHVQCLTFTTSKGVTFGPFGGEGYLIGKDREGEEIQVKAPANSQLAGFRGRGSDGLSALSFRWGPIP